MKHLGDITKISGYDAPIVNVVIGGSPCQDLSLAGKRAGLSGERSGLFMEQIRIIKEMRERDAKAGRTGTDVRPRFMVWENVPGAFSVNGGGDFAAVLEETIRVAEPEAPDIPVPRDGWSTAGCFMGGCWSVAWRVLDAQYWGVPQRRRRIALIADFGGQTAPEILFKSQSLSGHFEPCGSAWQGTAGYAEESTGNAVAYGISAYESNCMKSDNPHSGCYVADTSRTLDNNGGNPSCNQGGIAVVYPEYSTGIAGTLDASYKNGCGERSGIERAVVAQVFDNHRADCRYNEVGETAPTCVSHYGTGGNVPIVVNMSDNQQERTIFGNQSYGEYTETGKSKTLLKSDDITTSDLVCDVEKTKYTVRRLTVLECTRLQGFPDGWVEIGEWVDSKGKTHKDSDAPKYKALGNSIAIPPWLWVCSQMGQYLGEDKTMASLFDGIGGFPLIWSYLYGKENVLFCSEIEEFPIAVTKKRFGEE